ncbi:MAG TPA: NIPSNAP family protein [Planctomycetota bacterium]|nr:NIPSNAP family protein [Planctomycetota bacterium]
MSHTGLFVALLFSAVLFAIPARAEEKTGGERCFEMRTYYAAPGKMEALHARFRDHTNKLFVKHGMTLIGYWTPADKPEVLVYILAYPSKEARESSWKNFIADEDWKKAKANSEVNGKLVDKIESVFMKPTDYSPIK